MKMLGLTGMITRILQGTREEELHKSKRFRQVQIVNITLGTHFSPWWDSKSDIPLRKCCKHVVSRRHLYRVRYNPQVLVQRSTYRRNSFLVNVSAVSAD
jgi:hypothetical protein